MRSENPGDCPARGFPSVTTAVCALPRNDTAHKLSKKEKRTLTGRGLSPLASKHPCLLGGIIPGFWVGVNPFSRKNRKFFAAAGTGVPTMWKMLGLAVGKGGPFGCISKIARFYLTNCIFGAIMQEKQTGERPRAFPKDKATRMSSRIISDGPLSLFSFPKSENFEKRGFVYGYRNLFFYGF